MFEMQHIIHAHFQFSIPDNNEIFLTAQLPKSILSSENLNSNL